MPPDFAIIACATALVSAIATLATRPLGEPLRLIDHPDTDRKFHEASIPLTGGISLLSTLLVVFFAFGLTDPVTGLSDVVWQTLIVCLCSLVLLHAIDDVMELRSSTRFAIDIALALLICLYGMIRLTDLEDLFGFGTVWLGRFSIPMTIFCFVAASNAFNFTDGIDGLCIGLAIICFLTIIGLVAQHTGIDRTIVPAIWVVIMALIPIYAFNVGLFGERFVVFLGDSGARLIGFIAAIALVVVGFKNMIQPVTAFFPIAVPVCDCLVLMGWRAIHGRSPFSADRLHLHHLLLDIGFSQSTARHTIFALAIVFALCGLAFEWSGVPAWVISTFIVASFFSFIALRIWLYRLGQQRELA